MVNPAARPVYEIRVRGILGGTLLGAFPALSGVAHGGDTVLTGELPDQAALHGVLCQIESLGLELIALRQVSPRQTHRYPWSGEVESPDSGDPDSPGSLPA